MKAFIGRPTTQPSVPDNRRGKRARSTFDLRSKAGDAFFFAAIALFAVVTAVSRLPS